MPTLAKQFVELPPVSKRRVHFILGEHALDKWREYNAANPRITYVDRGCGTHQTVDTSLPYDAFTCAQKGCDDRKVADRYSEPLAAMQDYDLEFPDPVSFAYYAIYNLFNKYVKNEPIDDWLIVNQSLSSDPEKSKWRHLLDSAIQDAK